MWTCSLRLQTIELRLARHAFRSYSSTSTSKVNEMSTPILDEILSDVKPEDVNLNGFLSKGNSSGGVVNRKKNPKDIPHSESDRHSSRKPTRQLKEGRVSQKSSQAVVTKQPKAAVGRVHPHNNKHHRWFASVESRNQPNFDPVLSKHEVYRFWHQWYRGARKSNTHSIFRPTFLALQVCYELETARLISLTLKAFKEGNHDITYKHWCQLFEHLSWRVNHNLEINQQDLPLLPHSGSKQSTYGLLPVKFIKLIHQLRKLDLQQFDRFWKNIARSPLAIEIIPIFIHLMCNPKNIKTAHHILHHIDNEEFLLIAQKYKGIKTQREIYSYGVNYGLNVILYSYLGEKSDTNTTTHWREMYDLINELNPEIPIALLPIVSHHLVEIPSYTYSQFYKLLLTKRANFFNPRMNNFLKSLYASSDLGKQLIENTDEMVKEFKEQGEEGVVSKVEAANVEGNTTSTVSDTIPPSHPSYNSSFYKFLLLQLSKQKDSHQTAWFLENIILKNPTSNEYLADALRLLMTRAIEIDGMPAAYLIFETMIEKGIEPDIDLYRILFRGFRLHGQENECYNILNQVISKGYSLNIPFCFEFLTLICSSYGPSTVLQNYKMIYPSNEQLLESLGINEYIENWKEKNQFQIETPSEASLRFTIASNNIDPSVNNNPLPSLEILYKSISSQTNSTNDITNLYNKYKQFILTSNPPVKASIKIIDRLVSSLCRIQTQESINQAHNIFIDGITNLPLPHSMKKNLTSSAGLLGHLHCCPPRAGLGTDVTKAIQLVETIQSKNYIPMSRNLLTAIIKYFLTVHDPQQAQKWYLYAKDLGILITSQRINDQIK